MDCHLCGHRLKPGDVTQRLYVLREVSRRLRQLVGRDIYMEEIFAHLKCTSLGALVRRAAEKDYESRIAVDNSPDAVYMPPGRSSEAAMRYVQEHVVD